MEKLTLHIPFSLHYKYLLYPRNIESLEGLGTLGRLDLEGLLLFMYSNLIL